MSDSHSHYVLYFLNVKKDRHDDFVEAWQTFSSEIKLIYGAYGAMLFKASGDDFVVIGRWPDREFWERFWLTKEAELQSLNELKDCLSRPAETITLDKLFDNWA